MAEMTEEMRALERKFALAISYMTDVISKHGTDEPLPEVYPEIKRDLEQALKARRRGDPSNPTA